MSPSRSSAEGTFYGLTRKVPPFAFGLGNTTGRCDTSLHSKLAGAFPAPCVLRSDSMPFCLGLILFSVVLYHIFLSWLHLSPVPGSLPLPSFDRPLTFLSDFLPSYPSLFSSNLLRVIDAPVWLQPR